MTTHFKASAWVLLFTACAHGVVPFNPQPARARRLVTAATTEGPVAGFVSGSGLSVFLGIPYAEPPTGKLRWAPTEPPAPRTYVRPAFDFGPSCPQGLDENEPASLLFQDEDCLSLNIWSPGVDSQKRPVLVFIHGGGFIQGGSGDPLYNGEYLARRGGIVVATLNYRVAAPGFLMLDRFGPEFKGSGNLALADQIAGLAWLRNNIAHFGGDPANITIMGESAGSASVMHLMLAPRAKGLFQRVIAESGAVNLVRTRDQAEKVTDRFLQLAGVKDAAGLRGLPASRIVKIEGQMLDEAGFEADLVFAPVMDDILVSSNPLKAFEDGAAGGIALLTGTNYDEYRYWLLYSKLLKYIPPRIILSFAPSIQRKLGGRVDTILAHYRKVLPHPGWGGVTFAVVNDMMFRVPHIQVADLQGRHAPVWMYRFDWRSKASDDLGACHAIELPFVFRTFDSPTSDQIVGENPPLALSDLMMDAWISFVRTGSPAHPGLNWPSYDPTRRATMIFNDKTEVQDDPDRDSFDLYKGVLYP